MENIFFYLEDGGSIFLQNVGFYHQNYFGVTYLRTVIFIDPTLLLTCSKWFEILYKLHRWEV
jgi:hypothetical protein